MPGIWIRFHFLSAISGAMYSADLLLHLVYLATKILNQVHISHGQEQHFYLVQCHQEAGGTLFSSRCEELHPPLGAQPEATPQTFWGISCANIIKKYLL